MTEYNRQEFAQALGELIQKEYHNNTTAAAEDLGVSVQWLYRVLSGKVPPGEKVLSAVGYKQVITYRPADQ